MTTRPYSILDVFADRALQGNPLAVVHQAEGLSDAEMAAFARWTNLSETTFVLPPTRPEADYRVRIFTPFGELPFAGHPTLGTCRAWLDAGGQPARADQVVQECGVGAITVRRDGTRLAFAAPPCRRIGPLEADVLAQIRAALGIEASAIVDHQWVDNGPGWCAIRLASAAEVLALQPDWRVLEGLMLGVVGAHPHGASDAHFEVRALIGSSVGFEDPVTGSLNASLAQWLIGQGVAPRQYVAAQGAALGRRGRVHVDQQADGTLWIGGEVVHCVRGELNLP